MQGCIPNTFAQDRIIQHLSSLKYEGKRQIAAVPTADSASGLEDVAGPHRTNF